ncbi:MAG: hypothetical protein ACKOEH_03915 [Actinomycetota bacterium]
MIFKFQTKTSCLILVCKFHL